MVFSSLFFLYAFFPICMLLYVLMRSIQAKNIVLLVMSLVFYAWGEPKYIFLLILMAFSDWIFALIIERVSDKSKKRLLLFLACAVNLGLLGVFKYGTFILSNINAVTGFPKIIPAIALPIGISFYTFQLLSYVVDVYRGDTTAQKKFHLLLLYAGLFHQCIAGPIVRYSDIANEITSRKVSPGEVSRGITRFTVGLGKKALLANVCGSLAESLILTDAAAGTGLLSDNLALLASRPALALWLGMLMYMLQIYLDFSAYSDMAIGMGLMVGFHYKENFNYPYIARSVTDFWRRWHISLSTFFRDYVYIPLGGNRKGTARTYFNLFVVWALTGLWHGASWNFVLWGLYFFALLICEKLFLSKLLNRIPKIFGNIYLLIAVFFGWILFKFKDLSMVFTVIKGMFTGNGNSFTDFETTTTLTNYIFFIVVAMIAVTPLIKNISNFLSDKSKTSLAVQKPYEFLQIALPILLLLLSTIALVGDSYNPFLYFQF